MSAQEYKNIEAWCIVLNQEHKNVGAWSTVPDQEYKNIGACMKETMLQTIEKYHMIEPGDKLVLGVSGGPDSICMLNSLYDLKEELHIEICVAHINHGIRKEAEEDEAYVENYCKEKKIPFFCKREDVAKLAKKQKLSSEEAGRNVRYQFFTEVLEKTR